MSDIVGRIYSRVIVAIGVISLMSGCATLPPQTKAAARAVAKGDIDRISDLLDAGYDVNICRNIPGWVYSQSAEHDYPLAAIAIMNNNELMLRHLLDRGARLSYEQTHFTCTLLHYAAGLYVMFKHDLVHWPKHQSASVDIMKLLLSKGADVNAGFKDLTPLHFAAINGTPEAVSFLLKNGADPHLRTADGATPFDLANRRKAPRKQEVVNLLRLAMAEQPAPRSVGNAPIPPPIVVPEMNVPD